MKSIRSRVVSDKGPQRIQTHHLAAVLKRGRVSPLTFHVQHPFLVENLLFAHFLLFTLSLTFNYERWVLAHTHTRAGSIQWLISL
jgi:hypothetical protein